MLQNARATACTISELLHRSLVIKSIVIITASFPQNVNDSNNNSFLSSFLLSVIVFEPFPGGKNNKKIYTLKKTFISEI